MGALRWVKGARREGILAGADSPATHRTAAAPGRGGPLPANACGVAALTAAADAARSLTAALTAEVLQQVSKAKGACIPPPPTITEGSGRGQVHRSSSGGQRTAHEETRQRQSQHRASAHSAKRPSSTTLRQALNGHGGHPRPPAPPPTAAAMAAAPPPQQDLPLVSIPAVLVDRYTPLSNRAAMYGDTPSAGRIAMGIPGLSSLSSR